jgi:hypothetical protein
VAIGDIDVQRSGLSLGQTPKHFSLSNARCYNPNDDEQKIKQFCNNLAVKTASRN